MITQKIKKWKSRFRPLRHPGMSPIRLRHTIKITVDVWIKRNAKRINFQGKTTLFDGTITKTSINCATRPRLSDSSTLLSDSIGFDGDRRKLRNQFLKMPLDTQTRLSIVKSRCQVTGMENGNEAKLISDKRSILIQSRAWVNILAMKNWVL